MEMNTQLNDALALFAQLSPEQLAYAISPARGAFRGFAALHDLLDANMLLPQYPADESEPSLTAHTDRCNAAMSKFNELLFEEIPTVQKVIAARFHQ